ncbi:MAG: ribosome biogenesis GTP-binding protein YihA/YsxC [Saprospiraceae bacterium]
MQVKFVDFIGSFPNEQSCPQTGKPEYAFIGRSNVGKSSLINMLTARKNMARVSNTPGKTQLINYYLVNDNWYLVDLPGYGYAKISKKKRQEWEKMIAGYLQRRDELQCAFVLIDSNVPPQKIDVEFINWLGEMQIPFAIIYTKTDRLSRPKLEPNIKAIQEELLKYWNELPQQFITSSSKTTGREDVLDFIEQINDLQ